MTYLIRGIPLSLRLTLFALIEAAGIAVQFLVSGGLVPGTAIMAAGLLLTAARGYTNKPKDLGYEDWKPVSTAEFERIRSNLTRAGKLRLPLYYRGLGIGTFAVLGIGAVIASWFLASASGSFLPFVAALDTMVVAVPLFFTGLIRLWTPAELAMKTKAFTPVVDRDPGQGLVMTPYLRFDKDREGRQIPEDVRFMLELRRNPEDFVGVQFQIAVNTGPNGKAPYMYAVFLCRGKGETFRRIARTDFGSFIVEPGGDEEYGTVVVRQQTSGTGYHTDARDCRRLLDTVTSSLKRLPSPGPASDPGPASGPRSSARRSSVRPKTAR